MSEEGPPVDDLLMAWLDALASIHRPSAMLHAGTAGLIDRSARRRGAMAIVRGLSISLARPLRPDTAEAAQVRWGRARPAFDVEVSVIYRGGGVVVAFDHIELDCHGIGLTHIDALNHVGRRGTWTHGWAPEDPEGPSVADLADAGLFTRAVLVDIPSVRGTPWVDPEQPVTGQDIDAALSSAGIRFESGDALLINMGRDQYEADGGEYRRPQSGLPQPGVGWDGARWIADHDVSIVCWDFLDADHPTEPRGCVHGLPWAIGLILIDNCSLGPAARALGGTGVGALSVSPLRIPGGTGCVVNPQLLL